MTASATRRRLPRAAVWDGAALLAATDAATAWLEANRDRVNALNVFPVPDGDTGTNMGLTMRAAAGEGRASGGAAADGLAARVAFGALMGARGNSGVILSQVFRGFARAIEGRQEIDGRDLAAALTGASEMAYKAVMRPVEGTMLTVIRGAAERAEAVAARTPALEAVLAEAVRGARAALATTPDLLDILRQAGVVDAGGQGIVYILEGMDAYARGETLTADVAAGGGPLGASMAFLDRVDELHGDDAFGYCTNFMVLGTGIDVDRARDDIAAMGSSAVIVGDDTVLKIHIHADNPGRVLDYALALGSLDQVKIDNMQSQTRALTLQRAEPAASATAVPASAHDPPDLSASGRERPIAGFPVLPRLPNAEAEQGTQTVLAVAAGAGLAAALRSMGADGVVAGGQTMNPSTEELLAVVAAAPTAEVILLPNNPNIVLAANQVPALAAKRVAVVPSRSVPQGLAALSAFKPGATLAANVAAMTAALASVRTVEVTEAVRDATIDGVCVAIGQTIGLVDDRLVVAGDTAADVVGDTLAYAGVDGAELLTVFTGAGCDAAETGALRAALAARYPDLAVEVLDGGQPHYRYIVGVE